MFKSKIFQGLITVIVLMLALAQTAAALSYQELQQYYLSQLQTSKGQVLGASTPALVAHGYASAPAGSTATTPPMNTSGATLLVVVATDSARDSTTDNITDSLGNTWTHVNNYHNPNTDNAIPANISLWYAKNPTVGTSQTFSGTGNYISIFASAWSGIATTTPLDQQSGNGADYITTIQPGSLTPGSGNELLVTGLGDYPIQSPSVDSGFSILDTQTTVGAVTTGMTGGDAYLIQSSAAAVNPTWSDATSTNSAVVMAAFKPAPTGGSSQIDTMPPTVPTGLSGTASSTAAFLSWTASTDNVGVAGYDIYRCSGQGCTPVLVATSATDSYQDSGLSASTQYTYTVSSYDAVGNNSAQSSSVSVTTSASNSSSWNLTFSDEFSGTSLDTTKWNTHFYGSYTNANEIGGYDPNNISLSGGQAQLTAQKQNWTAPDGTSYNYTTGHIDTSGHFSQTYGYFEARLKVPAGDGFWPGFWALPASGTWPPEIDIAEQKGSNVTTNNMTLHWPLNGGDDFDSSSYTGPDFSAGFHDFAVDWEPGSMTWYVDGVIRKTMTTNIPTTPMYLIASLGIGSASSSAGTVDSTTPFPSSMAIDYIRAYTKVASGGCYSSIPLPTDPAPGTGCSSAPADTTAPTVPMGLTATAISTSTINLSWTASTDNVGVAGYNIYRGGVEIGTSAINSYSDTGLSASTQYSYAVSAYDAAGNNSSQSSVATAATQALAVSENGSVQGLSFSPQSSNIAYALINDNGTFYLILNNILHGITDPGVLTSYGLTLSQARTATAQDLALPQGSPLTPNNGSLVKSQKDHTVYLISNQQRYGFTSSQVFLSLGFKFSSVLVVTDPELQALPIAPSISSSSSRHLPGLDISHNGTIYWIGSDSQLHTYPSLAVYNSWHIPNDFNFVVSANSADLALPIGADVVARILQ